VEKATPFTTTKPNKKDSQTLGAQTSFQHIQQTVQSQSGLLHTTSGMCRRCTEVVQVGVERGKTEYSRARGTGYSVLQGGCKDRGGGGLRSGGVKTNCEKLRKNCGKIAGKLRHCKQPSVTLKVQQFWTGGLNGGRSQPLGDGGLVQGLGVAEGYNAKDGLINGGCRASFLSGFPLVVLVVVIWWAWLATSEWGMRHTECGNARVWRECTGMAFT
jgi:hypothetical protein